MSTQRLPPHRCPSSTFDQKARTSLRFKKVHWLPHSRAQILASPELCTIEHLGHSASFTLSFIYYLLLGHGGLLNSRLPKDDIRTQSEYLIWHTEGHSTSDLVAQWPDHQWTHKHSSKKCWDITQHFDRMQWFANHFNLFVNESNASQEQLTLVYFILMVLFMYLFFNVGHLKFDAWNMCLWKLDRIMFTNVLFSRVSQR